MPVAVSPRRVVVVEARHLDTDARVQERVEVAQPARTAEQRDQLQTIVGRLHPSARIRTFADGAASFLDAQHLIVAHYGDVVEMTSDDPPLPPSLFAA